MSVVGVVLAAGSGTRFGSAKQFQLLGGERLVDRAVRLVTAVVGPPVVALPEGHTWDGPPVLAAVCGGDSRLESLSAALGAVPVATEYILVHDPARPLATTQVCHAVLKAVTGGGADAAMSAWPTPDTIKSVRSDGSLNHLGREGMVVAQSPMAYRVSNLRLALEQMSAPNNLNLEASDVSDVDDAPVEETVVIEQLGGRVVAVDGDPWSHHIVEPRDLDLAHHLLADERFHISD